MSQSLRSFSENFSLGSFLNVIYEKKKDLVYTKHQDLHRSQPLFFVYIEVPRIQMIVF